MTTEQREAIDRLNKDKNKPLACGDITIVNISDLDTALSLIKEQRKENELAKEQLKKQCEIVDERNNLLVKVQELKKEIQDYKYLYEQALDNTLKADKENLTLKKQINLMALAILNYDDQLVINRYKNIDEVKETFKDLVKKGE